jgi:hypothetical protein
MSYSLGVDDWCVHLRYRRNDGILLIVAKFHFSRICNNFTFYTLEDENLVERTISAFAVGSKLNCKTEMSEMQNLMIDTLVEVNKYLRKLGSDQIIFNGQN